mmetsp:Transcript_28216/g.89869  ORF Transcript_28216/g.89869 Transcript_28216/m.89869 type:complete len:225 (-) Transcript_28216:103-777(-)
MRSLLRVFAWDLMPMMPPPHCLRCSSYLSLKLALTASITLARSWLSSFFTLVMQTAVAVFLCTSWPRRALDLTMQKGTSFLRQRAGSHTTSSTGSTSWAMHTSLALDCSMREVTWLMPYFTTSGLLDSSSSFPLVAFSACARRRSFLAALSSGRYFMRSLKSWPAVFLSRVWLNWLRAGGTLRRMLSTRRCLWMRTYLGHFTKRCTSALGGRAPPMPKVLALFS